MSKQVIEIYARHEKRNGLRNSEYHRKQLQTWIDETASVFEGDNSKRKLDALKRLMGDFCRPLGEHEYSHNPSGTPFIRSTARKGLYSGQKAVLEIIARQIKNLQPEHQHALLHEFIANRLERMGSLPLDAAHDPQRKAITMLAELLPALKLSATRRANLTAWLLHKLNDGKINMEQSVGGFFNRTQTSDVAAQVVSKELRSVRRKVSKIESDVLTGLKQTYEQAMLDYYAQKQSGPTNLHTDTWRKAFNSEKLDPSKWNKEQLKKSRWNSPPRTDQLEINALEVENARLRKQLEAATAPMHITPGILSEPGEENGNQSLLLQNTSRRSSRELGTKRPVRHNSLSNTKIFSNGTQPGPAFRSMSRHHDVAGGNSAYFRTDNQSIEEASRSLTREERKLRKPSPNHTESSDKAALSSRSTAPKSQSRPASQRYARDGVDDQSAAVPTQLTGHQERLPGSPDSRSNKMLHHGVSNEPLGSRNPLSSNAALKFGDGKDGNGRSRIIARLLEEAEMRSERSKSARSSVRSAGSRRISEPREDSSDEREPILSSNSFSGELNGIALESRSFRALPEIPSRSSSSDEH